MVTLVLITSDFVNLILNEKTFKPIYLCILSVGYVLNPYT